MADKNEEKMHVNDYTYVIEETVDELDNLIANAKKVIVEQEHLHKVVSASEDAKDFEGFLKGLVEDGEKQNAKIAIIQEKTNKLKELLKLCKDETTKSVAIVVCSLLFEGFGIMKKTPDINIQPEEQPKA